MKKVILMICLAFGISQAGSFHDGDRHISYHPQKARAVTKTVYVNRTDHRSDRAIGAIIGGVVGGILGHQIGGGSGNVVATVGGAVIGTVVGSNIAHDRVERRAVYYKPAPRWQKVVYYTPNHRFRKVAYIHEDRYYTRHYR